MISLGLFAFAVLVAVTEAHGLHGWSHGHSTSNNATSGTPYLRLVAKLMDPNGGPVQGEVEFVRYNSWDKRFFVEGKLTGLAPGKHGFHIHEFGNVAENCADAGGHYNKYKQSHGAPDAPIRHIGDLGNIEADINGVASFKITDSIICRSIAGRAVVIHSGEDDLGLGGFSDSLTTGHAGSRVACGPIIVVADGEDDE